MDNKRNLKTIIIPDLDKPEYQNMTRILNEFMDNKNFNAITKALPALFQHYEFVKFQLESETEARAKENKESYEARKKLRERIDYLETGQHKIMEVFNHFLPTTK
jgi:hypothetical protein